MWTIEQMHYQPTDRPTDQPTDTASHKGALGHLKRLRRDIVNLICILQLYSDLEKKLPECSVLKAWMELLQIIGP